MKSIFKFLVSTVLIVFLVACAPSDQVSETSYTPKAESVTNTNTPEPTASFTFEPTSTQHQTLTPTYTPTPTPTQTLTITPSLVDFDGFVINASNFLSLENYASLGKGKIESIDVSEDGMYHIIKTALGIFLYDSETLEELGFFEDYGFYSLIPGKNQIIAVTPALTLAVIDLTTASLIQELEPSNALDIFSIVVSKNSTHGAVTVLQPHATRQNWTSYRIDIWNLENGTLISQLNSELMGVCFSMGFSPDNQQLISTCFPSGWGIPKLFHWDIPSELLTWYITSESLSNQFLFSQDGSLFAMNESEQAIIRRSSDGAEVGRVKGYAAENPFSSDNKHIVTSSIDGISVWFVTTSQRIKIISKELGLTASYSDNGEYILANGGQMAWHASDFSLDETYPVPEAVHVPVVRAVGEWRKQSHFSDIMGVEMLEGDRLFIWGVSGNEHTLWWWFPEKDILEEISLGQGAGQPALSPSKDRFAACTQEGLKIITIEEPSDEVVGSCRTLSSPVIFSKDTDRLYLGSGIIIDEYDIESGTSLSQLRGHDYNIGYIKSSDSVKYLFSTSAEEIRGGRESIIWELDPNTFLQKWFITAGSGAGLSDAIFTHDDENLIAIYGNEVSIWRLSDGWYLANFEGTSAALSPDGTIVIVGTPNYELVLYDTTNWTQIGTINSEIDAQATDEMSSFFTFYSSASGFKDLVFINYGRVLISVTSDDVIDFWSVP